MSHFYNPEKRQKTYGFLTFSGGIEIWHWNKMGQIGQRMYTSRIILFNLFIYALTPTSLQLYQTLTL